MNLADRSTTIQCYYPKNAMNNSSGFAGNDLLDLEYFVAAVVSVLMLHIVGSVRATILVRCY